MSYKVFIDGQEGTTGLKIVERFKDRSDIELIRIDEDKRKDPEERKKLINSSDYTFLCLPDAAAVEAVSLVENDHVKIIDASTAHRTEAGWAYGLPELSAEHRQKIADSQRTAVPGCYASGFNTLMYPMVKSGIAAPFQPVICHAISGYSGGGKKLIAQYEDPERDAKFDSTRQYAMGKTHKHIKEMMAVSGLSYPPVFSPLTASFYNGMVVNVPFLLRTLNKKVTAKDVWEMMSEHYDGQYFVRVMPFGAEGMEEETALFSNKLADTNMLEIFVYGNDDYVFLASRLDNLGKGASGAAVQCMNIMMGIDEKTGLI